MKHHCDYCGDPIHDNNDIERGLCDQCYYIRLHQDNIDTDQTEEHQT